MHARSTISALLMLLLAPALLAQGFDAESVARGLTEGDTAAIQKARADAVGYLSSELRVSDRLAADEALGSAVQAALDSDDEFRVINALLVAGHLVTPTSLQRVTPFLSDERPGVRYTAYKAMRVSMDILSSQASPSLQPDAATSAIEMLVNATARETDPASVEAGFRAIAAAATMASPQLRSLADNAALALPTSASAHLARLDSIPDLDDRQQTLGAILYAMLELRIDLSNRNARMTDAAVRAATKLGGDMIAHAYRAYEVEGTIAGISEPQRAPLQQAIAASESLVFFGMSRLGADVDRTTIAEAFPHADDRAYRSGVLRIIGPAGVLKQIGIEIAGGPGAG